MVNLYPQTKSIHLTILKFRVTVNTLKTNTQTSVSAMRELGLSQNFRKKQCQNKTHWLYAPQQINFSGLQQPCLHSDKVELVVRVLKLFQRVFIEHLLCT